MYIYIYYLPIVITKKIYVFHKNKRNFFSMLWASYTNMQYFWPTNNSVITGYWHGCRYLVISSRYFHLRWKLRKSKKAREIVLMPRERETRFMKGSLKESIAEHILKKRRLKRVGRISYLVTVMVRTIQRTTLLRDKEFSDVEFMTNLFHRRVIHTCFNSVPDNRGKYFGHVNGAVIENAENIKFSCSRALWQNNEVVTENFNPD